MPDSPRPSAGDTAQIRMIVEQVVDAAMVRINSTKQEPSLVKPEIPAPLKWAAAVIAGLFTAGTATLAFWLVSSVSEMQVTLARMDERMASGTLKDSRFDSLDRRVTQLEGYHREPDR